MKNINDVDSWITEISSFNFIPEDLLNDYFISVLSENYIRSIEILKLSLSKENSLTKIYMQDSELTEALKNHLFDHNDLLNIKYNHFIITRELCDKKRITPCSSYIDGFAITRDFPNFQFTVDDIRYKPSMVRMSLEFMRDYLGKRNISLKKKEIKALVKIISNRNYQKFSIGEKINSILFSAWCLSLLKIIRDGIHSVGNHPKHIEYINSFQTIFGLEETINNELNTIRIIWEKFIYFETLPSFSKDKEPSIEFWEFLMSITSYFDPELISLLKLE